MTPTINTYNSKVSLVEYRGYESYVGTMNSFDFDQTLTTGLFTGKNGFPKPLRNVDIVLTGRTYNEAEFVHTELQRLGLFGIAVFFNPTPLYVRGNGTTESRITSGMHKVDILRKFSCIYSVTHWDDDPIQLELIAKYVSNIRLMQVVHEKPKYYADTLGRSWQSNYLEIGII